jgi:hypothetical protein
LDPRGQAPPSAHMARSRRMENGKRRHFFCDFRVVGLETDAALVAISVSGVVGLLVGAIRGGVMFPHSVSATAGSAPPKLD